jgi:hypothetical protein
MFTIHACVLPLSFPLILFDCVLHLPLTVNLAILELSRVYPAVVIVLHSEAVSLPCLELPLVIIFIDLLEGPLPVELEVEEFALVVGKRFLKDVPAMPRKAAISEPTQEDSGRVTSDPDSDPLAAMRFVVILRDLS